MSKDKKKEPPLYLLSGIPNDDEGKAFVKMFRKHLNRGAHPRVRVRGSGPGRKKYEQSLPLSRATTLRVYVECTRPEEAIELRRELNEALARNDRFDLLLSSSIEDYMELSELLRFLIETCGMQRMIASKVDSLQAQLRKWIQLQKISDSIDQ